MTPQEQSMLEDLIRKVNETKLTEKDPEAEQRLKQGLASDPDAVYKLAQTVLIQNLALNQARAQIQQLQQLQQAQPQPARSTSFLGGLLGHRDPAPPQPAQPQYQQVAYQPVPPQYAPPPTYYGEPPSAAGSFLRSAATTAAGVAAGALAFEGIESLIHGFGGGGGMWGGGGWGGFGSPAPVVDETVINNYYDDPQRTGDFGEHHEHEASFDDRPEGHADLKDANYQPGDDDDSRSFNDSQDNSQTDSLDSDFSGGDDFV
jgi:uncharacterized protein